MSMPMPHFLVEAMEKHEGGACLVWDCRDPRDGSWSSIFEFRVVCFDGYGALYSVKTFPVHEHWPEKPEADGDQDYLTAVETAKKAALEYAKTKATAI